MNKIFPKTLMEEVKYGEANLSKYGARNVGLIDIALTFGYLLAQNCPEQIPDITDLHRALGGFRTEDKDSKNIIMEICCAVQTQSRMNRRRVQELQDLLDDYHGTR